MGSRRDENGDVDLVSGYRTDDVNPIDDARYGESYLSADAAAIAWARRYYNVTAHTDNKAELFNWELLHSKI